MIGRRWILSIIDRATNTKSGAGPLGDVIDLGPVGRLGCCGTLGCIGVKAGGGAPCALADGTGMMSNPAHNAAHNGDSEMASGRERRGCIATIE
jgi:hypothetical protein